MAWENNHSADVGSGHWPWLLIDQAFAHQFPICGHVSFFSLRFFLYNELRQWHIKASSKSVACPAGIIRAGFFAPVCVRVPSKGNSSREIRERTKRKLSGSADYSAGRPIQLCWAAGAPDAGHSCGGKSSALPSSGPKTETLGRCASAGIALRPCREAGRPYQFHPYHDQRARPRTARAPKGSDVAKEIDEYVSIIRGRASAKGNDSARPPARRASRRGRFPVFSCY